MKNGERVYTSKYRKDISQLFRNCDIYYGTYPLSGGLMCQYAAAFGNPILAYARKSWMRWMALLIIIMKHRLPKMI